MKPTVAVDFDGVIHRYSQGWKDGSCYDEPMHDAKVALSLLLERYTVVIFSTRDPIQIRDWFGCHMPEFPVEIMQPHERFWNREGIIGITRHKPVAWIYIDDRGLTFRNWLSTMAELDLRAQNEFGKKVEEKTCVHCGCSR